MAKGENLTKANEDFAILFPSVSSIYVRFTSRPDVLIPEGRVPRTLPHDTESLNFLNEDKALFHYKWALYSSGHAEWNLDKSNSTESMIQQRDRSKTIVMGDSGGFQIATGVIKYPYKPKPAVYKLDKSKKIMLDDAGDPIVKTEAQTHEQWIADKDDIRLNILRWLEHTSDLSMILDLPTAAIARGHVESFEDCKRETLENMDFFVKNRVPEKTRFLNILQGIRRDQADEWWDTVKDYPFEGYAFGGENCANFKFILRRMLEMRDGKYFEQHPDSWHPRNWLHFLGISRLHGACAFTALQRTLRAKVDPALTISFDSASAFVSVANGKVLTAINTQKNRFGYVFDKGLDNKDYKDMHHPFPWSQNPVGDLLNISDICVRGKEDTLKSGKETKTSWDSYSYVLLMAHNVYMQIKAVQQANRLFRCNRKDTEFWVPRNLYEFEDALNDIFQTENSHTALKKSDSLLKEIDKISFGNGLFEQPNPNTMTGYEKIEHYGELFEQITGKIMGQGVYADILSDGSTEDFVERGDVALERLETEIIDTENMLLEGKK